MDKRSRITFPTQFQQFVLISDFPQDDINRSNQYAWRHSYSTGTPSIPFSNVASYVKKLSSASHISTSSSSRGKSISSNTSSTATRYSVHCGAVDVDTGKVRLKIHSTVIQCRNPCWKGQDCCYLLPDNHIQLNSVHKKSVRSDRVRNRKE